MSEITKGMEIKDGLLIVTLTRQQAATIANALGWLHSESGRPNMSTAQQEVLDRVERLQVSFEQAVKLMEKTP